MRASVPPIRAADAVLSVLSVRHMSGTRRAAFRSATPERKLALSKSRLNRLSSVSAFASFRAANRGRMYVLDVSAPVTALRRLLVDERASGSRDPSKPFTDVALFRSVLSDVYDTLDANPTLARPAELARLAAQLALAGVTPADARSLPLLNLLASLVESQVADLPPKHLATVAWAFSRMRATGLVPSLMPQVIANSETSLRSMQPQALSQLAWGVATYHRTITRAGDAALSGGPGAGTVTAVPTGAASPVPRILSRIASVAVSHPIPRRNPIALSQLVSSFAALDVPDPGGVYSSLAVGAVAAIRPYVAPRTVCTIVMAFATLYGNQPHVHFHHHARHRIHPGQDHYVEIPVGALTQDDIRPLFRAVERYCSERLPHFLPRDLAMLMWSVAKSGCGGPALYDALAMACEPHLDGLHPVALAQVAWSLAAMKDDLPPARVQVLTESIAAVAVEQALDGLPPIVSAVLAWSFAKTQAALPDSFSAALLQQCVPHLESMPLQEVCMLAHAVAQWMPGDEAADEDGHAATAATDASTRPNTVVLTSVMDQIADCAVDHFEALSPEDRLAGNARVPPAALTTLLWALARVGHTSPSVERLTSVVAPTAARDLYRFDPGQLSFTAWSLAKSPVPSTATATLLDQVLAECLERDTSSFLPQSLALLSWTCVRHHLDTSSSMAHGGAGDAAVHTTALLTRLAVEASRQLADFEPSHLAMLVLAFGRYSGATDNCPIGSLERDVLTRATAAAVPLLPDFSDLDLARLAWGMALARPSPPPADLCAALTTERDARGTDFSYVAAPLFDRAMDGLGGVKLKEEGVRT